MSRKPNIPNETAFIERRVNGERRKSGDRRSATERRHDFRDGNSSGRPKNIRIWLRSMTKARLGVDRRKGERRNSLDRRQDNTLSLLSQNEIRDLLSL